MTDFPPLPVLTKAERRKNCGACGSDIRGDRAARSSGLCCTCRRGIENRGRPLVPFAECKCDCQTHARYRTCDDGSCGDPVNRHVTYCCFTGPDNGDPEFRALFKEYECVFLKKVEEEQERRRKEREERWAREGPGPNEVVTRPRKINTNYTEQAVRDLMDLWKDDL